MTSERGTNKTELKTGEGRNESVQEGLSSLSSSFLSLLLPFLDISLVFFLASYSARGRRKTLSAWSVDSVILLRLPGFFSRFLFFFPPSTFILLCKMEEIGLEGVNSGLSIRSRLRGAEASIQIPAVNIRTLKKREKANTKVKKNRMKFLSVSECEFVLCCVLISVSHPVSPFHSSVLPDIHVPLHRGSAWAQT